MFKFALILLCLGTVSIALAQQPNPTIEIVLDQSTAQMGETIMAEVYVRGAVNIAGSDIGITVDPTCLRVIERQTGEFLPTEAEQRGFSAFSELNNYDTRLAASLLKDGPIANGDGVFFRATLEVTCETGIAPIDVSFVELTGVEDPTAENATLVVYRLDRGNVDTINAQLEIVAQDSVTPEASMTTVPTVTPDIAPVVPVVETTSQNQSLLVIAVVVLILSGVGLLTLFVVARRRKP